jgi:hypothetical protein
VLIGELSHAASLVTLDAALTPYSQPHVLMLDEIRYLAHAADAANVLYGVVNERYLRQLPILVTTKAYRELTARELDSAADRMDGDVVRLMVASGARVSAPTRNAASRRENAAFHVLLAAALARVDRDGIASQSTTARVVTPTFRAPRAICAVAVRGVGGA